ncbi:MAG: AT hook motif domain protein [Archangium sp.]|nr:AT hook motif domain protein [Archangium sp.]
MGTTKQPGHGGKVGRPRREEGPKLPHLEVDQLLVEGELVDGADGTQTRVWPSQREIAKRFEVAPSLVAAFSKQHQCVERRAAFQAAAPIASAPKDDAPAIAPAPEQAPAEPSAAPPDSSPSPALEPGPVDITPAPVPGEPKRKPGRPRKAEAPLVPYEEVDRLLVYGEATVLETGATTTLYPTHRQLALRYGVSPSVIASYAKSHNCVRRREQAAARVAKRTEDKLVELRSEAIAVGEDRLVQMIDNFLLSFEKALEEGRVRSDNPTDVNTLARLKVFILGGADSRQEVRTMLSLESLQERHARMLRDMRDATPELAGVVDARAVESEHPAAGAPEVPALTSSPQPPPPGFVEAAQKPPHAETDDEPDAAANVAPPGSNGGEP